LEVSHVKEPNHFVESRNSWIENIFLVTAPTRANTFLSEDRCAFVRLVSNFSHAPFLMEASQTALSGMSRVTNTMV
jgi:hypothetical protein